MTQRGQHQKLEARAQFGETKIKRNTKTKIKTETKKKRRGDPEKATAETRRSSTISIGFSSKCWFF